MRWLVTMETDILMELLMSILSKAHIIAPGQILKELLMRRRDIAHDS
jgi:hypothetical protein